MRTIATLSLSTMRLVFWPRPLSRQETFAPWASAGNLEAAVLLLFGDGPNKRPTNAVVI